MNEFYVSSNRRRAAPKEISMDNYETAIAVFSDHDSAETAVKTLTAAGFDMRNLSVVGKGYHSEERVVGFYNIGDRIKFWGARGAFWGGFWGLFFGGLFIATPLTGPVFVVGFLTAAAISAIESAAIVGGLGALGAALYSIGVPEDSVLQYESDIKADGFLVMARGPVQEVERAKKILGASTPARIDVHGSLDANATKPVSALAMA